MSWGISFLKKIIVMGKELVTDIFISHEHDVVTIYELNERISIIERDISGYEEQLLAYASSNPKDVIDAELEIIPTLQNNIKTICGLLAEDTIRLYQLNLYKEYLENKENEKT